MSPEDRQLADLLVAQGLCSRERVDECVAFLDRLSAEGVSPLPKLGELLVRKGYLSSDRFQATVRQTTPPTARRETRARGEELPKDVTEALQDPARQLGKYVKVSRLGAGGMGEVWRAWDRDLSRWVALKFLKYDSEEDLVRFRREAETAARLSHPNIAAVYEITEHAGKPMIAMEYVAGSILTPALAKDLRELVELLKSAALAVHYAHERGVIHRDLKPSNLMVSSLNSAAPRVFIMDFGLAKETTLDSSITVSGAILGTPAYMSPEQARGQADLGPASDVYSLGATLYDLLAKQPPFVAKDLLGLLKKVVEDEPASVRRKNPRVDAELDTILLKCLEKDPRRRYPTALALAEDLDRWLKREPILAHPPSTAYRLRKYLVRHKAVAIPTAAAVLLAVSAGIWLTSAAAQKKDRARTLMAGAAQAEKARNWEKARDLYRSARDLDDPDAPEGLGRVERELARLAKEREAADRAAKAEQAALDQAVKLLEAGRPALDQAVRYLYNKDAEYDELVRRVEAAQKQIEQAVRTAPKLAPAQLLLGRAWEIRGSDDLAEAAFRKALELDPKFGAAHFRLGRLLLRRTIAARVKASEEDAPRRAGEADRFAREAEQEFQAARTAGLDEEIDREFAATMSAYIRRDFVQLEDVATRAISRFRTREGVEEFHWLRACATADLKLRAIELDRALELRPKYPEALTNRAYLRYSRKELDGALSDLTEALKMTPKDAGLYVSRGAIRAAKRDIAGAISDYDEALRLDPRSCVALQNRGNARRLRGDLKGALADLEEAVRVDPESGTAYMNRGVLRVTSNNLEGGLEDFTKALGLGAPRAECLRGRGVAYFSKGDLDAALADLDEAVRLEPREPLGYFFRGNIRMKQRDYKNAVSDFDLYLAARPTDALVWADRGNACGALGDTEEALRSFRKALEVASPAWSRRAAVEARIRELEKK